MCAANADDTNVNTIRNKNVRTIKDYVEIGKVMLPYALLCANHVLNEFYNAFGVTGENYTEAYRNGDQNTENQESQSLESGYAPRYLVKQVVQQGEVLRKLVQEHVHIFGEELAFRKSFPQQSCISRNSHSSVLRNPDRTDYLDHPCVLF